MSILHRNHRRPQSNREFTGKVEIKFTDLPAKAQAAIAGNLREDNIKVPRRPLTGIERHWEDVALQERYVREAERMCKVGPLLAEIEEKERELRVLRSELYAIAPEYQRQGLYDAFVKSQQAQQQNMGLGPNGGLLGLFGGALGI